MRDLQLLKAAIIVFAFLMFLCAVGSCEATTPPWVKEFRAEVSKIEKEHGLNHESMQDSLSSLKKTGKGNCVAFSKLMAEICLKHGQKIELFTLSRKGEVWSHRVSAFKDKEGWWIQSNWNVHRIGSEEDIKWWSGEGDAWDILRRWEATKEDLEDFA